MQRTQNVIEIKRLLATADRLQTGEILPTGKEHNLRVEALTNAMAKNEQLLDSIQTTFFCQHCRTASSPANLHVVVTDYSFSTVYEFITQTIVLLRSQLNKGPERCFVCKSPLQKWIDRHHLERSIGRDLVIRLSKNDDAERLSYQLLWMDRDGSHSEVTLQEIPQLENVPFEAIENAAMQAINQGSLDKAARIAKDALYMYPGHRGLLRIASRLACTAKRGIGEAIAEAHISHHPTDPDGYTLLAYVYLSSFVACNGRQQSLLADAQYNAEKALRLNPDLAQAALVMSDCLRLQRAPDHVITGSYKDLLRKHPSYTPALYNYGLHCLSARPQEALSCFDKGFSLDPSDVDFLIGKAQAFLQMQLPQEAQQTLARAKKIVPLHPHVTQLMARIDMKPTSRVQ